MEIWLKILPETTRKVDTIAQNLEFNLNVYFAIYPIHDYVDNNQSKVILSFIYLFLFFFFFFFFFINFIHLFFFICFFF